MSAGLIQDRVPPHPEMILPEYQQYQLAEMYKLALMAAMVLVSTSSSAALCISIPLSVTHLLSRSFSGEPGPPESWSTSISAGSSSKPDSKLRPWK